MQYRPYGRLGINVSALGFGAMRLPANADGKMDPERAVPLLRRAIELGVNYIDSAHVYGGGTSEIMVGKAIQGLQRESIYIATKIPVDSEETAQPENWRKKLEISLQRLDTPYIDFLHFHGLRWPVFNELVSRPGMTLEAARKAQAEGLVRHIVFSSHDTTENITRLIDTGEFAGMLVQYNYLDRHNEPVITRAGERGMGVIIMGPVAGGRLALPNGIAVDDDGLLELRTPDVALRFVWNNPHVTVALSGMSTLEQVEENAASASRVGGLDDQESQLVLDLVEKNQKLSDLYCTGCNYCMPCPNGVNIPENFRYMNWFRVWGMEKEAQAAYARMSENGVWTPWAGLVKGLKAEACLECGECLADCPQNIPIIDQLREVAATLKTPEQPAS